MDRQLMTEMRRLVDAAMNVQLAQADWRWQARTYGSRILNDLQGPDTTRSFAKQAGVSPPTMTAYTTGTSVMTPAKYLNILYNCKVFGLAKEIEAHRAMVRKLEDKCRGS